MQEILLSDTDWQAIDGKICKAIRFTPFAQTADQKTKIPKGQPYALLALEVPFISPEIVAAITHKDDFKRLWTVFNETGIGADQEVVVTWVKSGLRGVRRLIGKLMPGLVVMVLKKGAYDLMTDRACCPEIQGQARGHAMTPILRLDPSWLK